MTENLFAMISDWMASGNINDFVKAYPDANLLGLVGALFSLTSFTSHSLTIR